MTTDGPQDKCWLGLIHDVMWEVHGKTPQYTWQWSEQEFKNLTQSSKWSGTATGD